MAKAQKSHQPPSEMTVTQLLDAVKTLRQQNSSLKGELAKMKRQILNDERVKDEHRAMQELLQSIRDQVSADWPSDEVGQPSARRPQNQRSSSQKRTAQGKNAHERKKMKSEPTEYRCNDTHYTPYAR